MEKKYQIFISSTFTDLRDERQAAVEAILRAGHIPAGMELFTSANKTQWDVIKKWINESDIYLLILGSRYGSIEPESGISYTELEYNYAVSLGKPYFAVVISEKGIARKKSKKGNDVLEKNNIEKLEKFRKKVLSKMSSFFDDPKDLKLEITESILNISKQTDLRGWVRYGEYLSTVNETLVSKIDKNPRSEIYNNEYSEIDLTLKDKYDFNSVNIGKKIREIWIFLSEKSKQEFALYIGIEPRNIDDVFQGNFIIDYIVLNRIIELYGLPCDYFVKPTYYMRFAIWREDIIRYAIYSKIEPKIDIRNLSPEIYHDIIIDLAMNIISFSDFLYPVNVNSLEDSIKCRDNKLHVYGSDIEQNIRKISIQYYKILEQCPTIDKERKKTRLEILLSGWFVTSGTYISRIIHESIKKIVIANGKVNVIYTFWDDINRGKLSYFDYDENKQRIIK